jgi:hypothetical protein
MIKKVDDYKTEHQSNVRIFSWDHENPPGITKTKINNKI